MFNFILQSAKNICIRQTNKYKYLNKSTAQKQHIHYQLQNNNYLLSQTQIKYILPVQTFLPSQSILTPENILKNHQNYVTLSRLCNI